MPIDVSQTDVPNSDDANTALIQRLVRRHTRSIRRIINRRSGPELLKRTSADDLFQDTVAEAIDSADTFEYVDDRRFIAWITTIARRVIATKLRVVRTRPGELRIRRPGSSGVGVPDRDLFAAIRTPSSIVAADEHKSALAAAMRGLPEHYRQIITLYKIDGLPMSDVASKMNRSTGACASLLVRAMNALRDQFAKP